MVASSHASIDGGGNLVLDGSQGNFAWAVFDLGGQPNDFSIGTVNFPDAPDWSTILPLPNVFVGCSIYSVNHWEFRQRKDDGTAANFNDLPPAASFLSASNHSYLAILGDSVTLNFGDKIAITGNAGPGGELPAQYTVDFTGLPAQSGLNNQIIVKPDFSGGDIVTYCPADGGGALVRFTYDTGTDAYDQTVTTLFGSGEALQGCNNYRLDYYADGRLAIGAAHQGPNSIREVREDSAGSASFPAFDRQTAVDNTFLPTDFTDPQYDYKVDSDGNVHALFLANTGKLAYAFEIAGSYGIDSGGPDIDGAISLKLLGADDMICAYAKQSGLSRQLAVRKFQQAPPNNPGGIDFGSEHVVYTDALDAGALSTSLAFGQSSSILVAHTINHSITSSHQLGFGYSADGILNDTWTTATADDGGPSSNDVGLTPSVGVLRDGTPVIAYYDATNLSLRFAISTVPDGNNATGDTWTTYRIDTSRFGSQVGLNPALGVLQRSGADPDKVIVAYGVSDGATDVLRVIRFDAPAH
jgi:hypothetical protein